MFAIINPPIKKQQVAISDGNCRFDNPEIAKEIEADMKNLLKDNAKFEQSSMSIADALASLKPRSLEV